MKIELKNSSGVLFYIPALAAVLVFILKLTDVVSYSWTTVMWVVAGLMLPYVLAGVLFVLIVIAMVLASLGIFIMFWREK